MCLPLMDCLIYASKQSLIVCRRAENLKILGMNLKAHILKHPVQYSRQTNDYETTSKSDFVGHEFIRDLTLSKTSSEILAF